MHARFAALHWALRGLICLCLGAVAGLGQAPTEWWPVTLVALAVLFAAHGTAPALRPAVWQGWAFGIGYFMLSLRWIVAPFHVNPERDGWMAPFAIILLAAGLAIFWALAAGVSHRLRPRHAGLFAVLLALAEVTRALIFTGFPWASLGHALIDTPYAQIAAFTGPHGLTALICLAALAVASLPTAARLWGGAGLALIATAWPILVVGPAPDPASGAPIVRLVQPNAPQDQKWDVVMSSVFFERMIGFTGAEAVPDLVVWPESAIPDLLNHAEYRLTKMSDAARGAPVILGITRREEARYYNSFALLGRGGLVGRVYDKQHLVPFGEYVPGGELLGSLGIGTFAPSQGGGFSPGTTARLMDVPGIGLVRPMICYEGIFAEEVGTDERARTMILVTNDAWFGKDAGPFQHLAQARLRAIEQGLPMVRVANTGVSAMIDARGRVTARIALNTAGFLDAALPPALPPTLYVRTGDWPVILLLLALAAVSVLRARRKIA